MGKDKIRFSLQKKATVLIVAITVVISVVALCICYKTNNDMIQENYVKDGTDLARTVSVTVDAQALKEVRDQVMEIYDGLDTRVDSTEWGTPAWNDYVAKFSSVEEMDSFQEVQKQLRLIYKVNDVQSVYITWSDAKYKKVVYLVDGSGDGTEEDYCSPGVIDPMMPGDEQTITDPDSGYPAMISNTDEYGWLIAVGVPVYANPDEIVGFACVDISMNEVVAQQHRYLLMSGLILLFVLLASIMFSMLLVTRTVVRPINKLSEASMSYYNNDAAATAEKFAELDIRTGDEIEILARSMAQMEQDINDHITNLLAAREKLVSTQAFANEMDEMAHRDALTGVRNKRAYDMEIGRINKDIVNGKGWFGLLMLDMNDLKKINDNFGHEKGDLAIRRLSEIICDHFKYSMVFRIGGDEFVVIMESRDYDEAEERVGLLGELLEKERRLGALPSIGTEGAQEGNVPWEHVSAAYGYAAYVPSRDENYENVFERAEAAMYACKKEMKAGR